MVVLNTYRLSAEDLQVPLNIEGCLIDDWIDDIKSRLKIIAHKEEEKQLKVMEARLEELLLEDKRVELELDNIEVFIG